MSLRQTPSNLIKCHAIDAAIHCASARCCGNRSTSTQVEHESDAEAAAPPEDARAKRPQRRRATMKTIVDDGHKYICFGGDDGLGVKAVQRMMQNATATAAEGTRGDKFVLDKNTGTYSLMKVVAASSSPDTVSLRYLKQGDDHSAPVLTDMCINALLTVAEIEAATKDSTEIRFVPLLRRDELKVREDDLAFAKKLATAPNADVADLFYRDEPLTDKAPYNNNSGRFKYHSERKPLVHRKVVEENSDALFVIVDYSVVSGGKGAAAEARTSSGAKAKRTSRRSTPSQTNSRRRSATPRARKPRVASGRARGRARPARGLYLNQRRRAAPRHQRRLNRGRSPPLNRGRSGHGPRAGPFVPARPRAAPRWRRRQQSSPRPDKLLPPSPSVKSNCA